MFAYVKGHSTNPLFRAPAALNILPLLDGHKAVFHCDAASQCLSMGARTTYVLQLMFEYWYVGLWVLLRNK